MEILNEQFSNGDSKSGNYKMDLTSPAVIVRNAHKSYGNGLPVLDNLHVNVPTGTIYGLLGASGCGKTTILSCLVGLKTLDSGTINIFERIPGTRSNTEIGFMPQEIAIQSIFTITEILEYYSRIYGMSAAEVEERRKFLIKFLDLPDSNILIKNCSGGQQRRISLAVAMLHKPRLLILDEPTAGIDPSLRESIWKHLVEMTETHKTTVIISTHYIQEARQANHVGILRNGRLLVESKPNDLLATYETQSLENVFLDLCRQDEKSNRSEISIVSGSSCDNEEEPWTNKKIIGLRYNSFVDEQNNIKYTQFSSQPTEKMSKQRNNFIGRFSHDFSKTKAVVLKNFLTLMRMPWYLLPLILIPPVQVIIFNALLGHDPAHVPFGIVINELRDIENPLQFCEQHEPGCFSNYTSCQFLNNFEHKDIDWVSYPTEEEALNSVENGDVWGYIYIPEDYTKHLSQRSTLKNFVDNETLIGTTITGRLDNSFAIKSEFIKYKIRTALQDFAVQLATICGSDPREVQLAFEFKAIYGSTEGLSFNRYIQPGCILLIILLIPMASGMQVILDRNAGTLQRSLVAGLEYIHTILGFLISEGILIAIQLALCFGVMTFFKMSILGSPLLFLSICFLEGIVGLAFGFLFGNLCNSEIQGACCIISMFFPIMVTSGIAWPVQGIPAWAKFLSSCNPLTRPAESLRSIMNRGWDISHPNVYSGVVTLFCYIFIVFILSGVVSKVRNK